MSLNILLILLLTFNNSKSSLHDQQNLGSNLIESGLKTPQESYFDKSVLTQSEMSLI